MYSVRPGTDVIPYFMPAGRRNGMVRDSISYPHIYPGKILEHLTSLRLLPSVRSGNKYVTIYSGYSGREYGLGMTNSTLRYAYGDSPLGPWKSGGVLVHSRAPVLNQDGTHLETSNAAHNTHGSIEQINGQWYVFYHRPPRGFGNARQAMVAPIHVEWDEKGCVGRRKSSIKGYDPYAKDGIWTAKDAQGNEYKGAEVTSEGFHIFGLDPYQYYSAGFACYLSDVVSSARCMGYLNNHASITNVKNGNIIGYKYFGFGGLDKDKLGLKAFKGTQKGIRPHLIFFPHTENIKKRSRLTYGWMAHGAMRFGKEQK